MPSADATPSSPPTKYTRYRRRTADVEPASPPPPPVVEVKTKDEGITRSMSRYRRSRVVPKTDHNDVEPIPEMPRVPKQLHSQTVNENDRPIDLRDQSARRNTDPLARSGNEGAHRQPRETDAERAKRKAQRVPEEEDRREAERAARNHQVADEETAKPRTAEMDAERRRKAKMVLEEQERQETEQDALKEAREQQRILEEADRRLEEQKRKDLERLEAELDAAPAIQRVSSASRLRFWRKGTKSTPTSPKHIENTGPSFARAQSRGIGSRGIEETIHPIQKRYDEPRKVEPPPMNPNTIVHGGGRTVHQTDAPISASNAGERRVLIRCNQASINLPITPETTPVELISSAANTMSQPISIPTAILIESYTQVGLERRVRRYEHVRDIMNSWDRDAQNALTIENSETPHSDFDLEVAHATKYCPADFTVYMYHSQKPGKWNKRYITLQASGQMFISKKQNAKSTDKDVVNICHLSDFDIYTPTPQQSKKVLKPPKKHCYAIKSQQKPAMFLSTENFVHFFCTDDRKLSWSFYETIQQWRSWYLVTKMGEGAKAVKKSSASLLGRTMSRGGQSSRASADDNPYTIGSFQPLMASDRFASQEQKDADDEIPLHIPFHLRNGSTAKRNSNKYPPTVNYKVPGESLDEFATDGLLGRSYSQRQQQLKGTDADNPFTDGPSLLSGPKASLHHRSLSVKSTRRPETSGSGLGRSGSQRQKPKPLLDFTPTFKEAPQWDKTGKGHGVKAVNGMPLVDVATGPESAVPGLPGTLFRREPLGGPLRPTTSRSSKERDEAFIKGGLVSRM